MGKDGTLYGEKAADRRAVRVVVMDYLRDDAPVPSILVGQK